MTLLQKENIALLRGKGESYAKIATTLGMSENTVKSFCRRNNLGVKNTTHQPVAILNSDVCKNCAHPLAHIPKAKKKRFCSDKCRMAWWNSHPEAVNRKAVYRFRCMVCDTPFESYGNAHRKYCSRDCSVTARRVLP